MNAEESRFMTEPAAIDLLAGIGVPYPVHIFATTAKEAVAAAGKIGFPVVLKVVSPDLVHKSDLGGVEVGLADGPEVAEAFERIVSRVRAGSPGAAILGALVCQQAPEGVEVIVGATQDQVFGPTVMCGLGGVFAEVLQDVAFRVAPFELIDAEEMIRELKGYPALIGVRGRSPADLEALGRLLVCVSRLVHTRPDILELDLNPVRVYENGLLALDARIRCEENGRQA